MLESTHTPAASQAPGNPLLATILLRDYFQALADRGQSKIALTIAGRAALRTIVSGKRTAPAVAPVKAAPAPEVSEPAAKAAAVVAPAAAISRPQPLPQEERIAKLNALRAAALTHAPARSLGTLRDTMVFAVGDPMARIMFVGEAPGAEEEAKQEPFVGPAGHTLTKMIKAMGLEREQVYISNICKFRPKVPSQGTENRKPNPDEMAACVKFIQEEIDIVQPEVIVALGATATEGLLGLASVVVGRMRSKFQDYQGIPVMITYHPSYLLHTNAMSERRKVWEDLMKVMEKVGLPISEKQRGFFLPKS